MYVCHATYYHQTNRQEYETIRQQALDGLDIILPSVAEGGDELALLRHHSNNDLNLVNTAKQRNER